MYDIVIGRNKRDKEKYGKDGTIFLGRHYVTMGQTTSLSNNVYMDMIRSHVVFICGKRGGGKSYTMGVVAEGMADMPDKIKQNISIIMLDTMGIYWTMKYPNKKDDKILAKWGLEGKADDITIYTPKGFFYKYKEEGIPTDKPFSIKPNEFNAEDWCMTFDVELNSPHGVLIQRILNMLNFGTEEEQKENENTGFKFKDADKKRDYAIEDIVEAVKKDTRADKDVKDAVENMFFNTIAWGVFDRDATPIKELAAPGQVTVIDVSCYATVQNSWRIKSLVIGQIANRLFVERMVARKMEEYNDVNSQIHYYNSDNNQKQEMPMVWLVIDEAHEFMPKDEVTASTGPLVTILREGRQPGISLILATQQPGKIHTDVMTQSDTVISHRLTTKIDIDALSMLMQSYMRDDLNTILDGLPRVKGAALIFDDTNEKMYPVQIRPRYTWHGGEAPTAIHKQKEERFSF